MARVMGDPLCAVSCQCHVRVPPKAASWALAIPTSLPARRGGLFCTAYAPNVRSDARTPAAGMERPCLLPCWAHLVHAG